MLGPGGATTKHTLQDDLESLLYVVLYCALLYLPHNLSEVELARTIRLFFEDAELMDGRLVGGVGKLNNAALRTFTKSLKFNPPLKEWLDAMMNYCNPPHQLEMDEDDPWTDVHLLDQFWTDFLATHTFETNDRQPHEHPHVTDKYDAHDEAVLPVSSEAIALGKRTSEECGTDHPRSPKRSRLSTGVSTPSKLPRRSERIRVLHERSQSRGVTRSNAGALERRAAVPMRGRATRRGK